MSEQEPIVLSELFPVSPDEIYAAWLDSESHGAMIGSGATISGRHEGAEFTAWDGYISGRFLKLEPGQRLTMSWRSEDYPPEAADSTVEVTLESVAEGTRMTLKQEVIPPGQREDYVDGWREFYLEPMLRYFSGSGDATRGAETAPENGASDDGNDEGAAEWMPVRVVEATEAESADSDGSATVTPITLVPSTSSVTLVEVVEVEDPDAEWVAVQHIAPATAIAKKPPVKKPAAKNFAKPAAKKSAPKKPAAKKATAKKPATVKAAKKPAGKKVVAHKPATKKAAAKKPPAKKAAPEKPPAKKAAKKAGKKPATGKAAKKAAPKKPAAKPKKKGSKK